MKKALLIIQLIILSCASSSAMSRDPSGVDVANIDIIRKGEYVSISFTLYAGNRVTAKNRSLVVIPALRKDGQQSTLVPIIVKGAKAAVNDVRNFLQLSPGSPRPFFTLAGGSVDYQIDIPYEMWMDGCDLILDGMSIGKGHPQPANIGKVAGNILNSSRTSINSRTSGSALSAPDLQYSTNDSRDNNKKSVVAPPIAPRPYPGKADALKAGPATSFTSPATVNRSPADAFGAPSQQDGGTFVSGATTGEELSSRFTFVESSSAMEAAKIRLSQQVFDYNMPLTIGSSDRGRQKEEIPLTEIFEDAAAFQFSRRSATLSRELGNNNRMLVDLISTVRMIESSLDTKIHSIVVIGVVSPEEATQDIQNLGLARAASMKDFLVANSNIPQELITVKDGSIGWSILRNLVAQSDMPVKYEILDIIDNTPNNATGGSNVRIKKLRELKNGEPYRYLLEYFFPKLPQMGAYVKIYYDLPFYSGQNSSAGGL